MQTLSEDILRRIADILPQRDAASLHCAARAFACVYPRDVTRVFRRDAPIEEYEEFLEWVVARPDLRSLHVYVDCVKWNEVVKWTAWDAPPAIVGVYPNDTQDVKGTPWFPAGCETRCGFVTDDNVYVMSRGLGDITFFSITTFDPQYRGPAPSLPHMGSASTFDRVSFVGTFRGLTNIPPTVSSISVQHAVLTSQDIEYLASFTGALEIRGCSFPTSFRTFQARQLSTEYVETFMIDAPRCTRMKIYLSGDPQPLGDRPPHAFADLEILEVGGYCFNADSLPPMLVKVFPNARAFDFNYEVLLPVL